MNPYLFVYGTLKNDSPHEMARYLRANAVFQGEGRMPGQIVDLGEYPGAVYLDHGTTFVSGHIFKLHRPEEVLKLLDRYEGIGGAAGEPDEYTRAERPVQFGTATMTCWVYLWNSVV